MWPSVIISQKFQPLPPPPPPTTITVIIVKPVVNCNRCFLITLDPRSPADPLVQKLSTPHQLLQALSLALLPVLYFFSFLYYTDAGSTFLALLAYLMCAHGRHGAAALVSLLALCFRQTNVVWVAFYAGTVVCQVGPLARESHSATKTLLLIKTQRLSKILLSCYPPPLLACVGFFRVLQFPPTCIKHQTSQSLGNCRHRLWLPSACWSVIFRISQIFSRE